MRCPTGGQRLRIPADEHPVLPRGLPCPGQPLPQKVGRPSGLADKRLSLAIHRFAHFLSKYCAESLTSGIPSRRNYANRAPLGTKIAADEFCCSIQEEPWVRPPHLPRDHWPGQEEPDCSQEETDLHTRDAADAIFYIQKGKVRLTVVSKTGKEATIGVLSEENFFGEGALAGQALRMGSAEGMTDCQLLRIEKKAMMDALHREHAFSDMFVAYLLARNIRYEEDLVDQLFNSSEKRLARVLLMLAHFGKEGVSEAVVPKFSQETLAEMVGTTRSRVSFFMNRFRKLGFIQYSGGVEGGLEVHSSLLNVVLHD